MAAVEIRWVCKGQQSGRRRCGPSPTVGDPSPEACSSRPTQATDGRRPPRAAVRRPRCCRFSGQAAAASPSASSRGRSTAGRPWTRRISRLGGLLLPVVVLSSLVAAMQARLCRRLEAGGYLSCLDRLT